MSKMLEWRETEFSFKSGLWGIHRYSMVSKVSLTVCGIALIAERESADEAKALAQKLQDVLDGQPSISEVLEQVVGALVNMRFDGAPEHSTILRAIAIVRSFMPPASEGGEG